MTTLRNLSLLLVIVGALNWLLVGVFGFDLVAAVTGDSFGQRNAVPNLIYALVGIAGLVSIFTAFGAPRPASTVSTRHNV